MPVLGEGKDRMTTKAENPDTFLVEYTSRLMVRHLLLIEDHLLEFSREPTAQCLSCLFWHLEKLISYSSLECVKFEGMDAPTCKELSEWAAGVQDKMEGLKADEAIELAKQAREYRYKMAEMAPAPVNESPLLSYLKEVAVAELRIPAPFGWVGGKRQLSKTIVPLIPPHRTYVEPFCGAASVFWAKEPSEVEVLNDLDPDLMRFYQELPIIDRCDIKSLSGSWEKLKEHEGELEPCEFLSLVECSFGTMRGSKAVAAAGCRSNAVMFHKRLPVFQERIKGVKLHNEDWRKVAEQYDSPDTFFYLDPPYHGTSRGYRYGEDQLLRLAETLPKLKGKWLLSYDDDPDVRKAFAKFTIVPVKSRYTVQAGSNKQYGHQLLIANYPLDGAKLGEMFEVNFEISATKKGKPVKLSGWVDTGGSLTVIPQSVADKLKLERQVGHRQERVFDGTRMAIRPVYSAYTKVMGKGTKDLVWALPTLPPDECVLGMYTLELLALEVDVPNKRLKEGFARHLSARAEFPPSLEENLDPCQEARSALVKYLDDVKAGHTEAAQYWKGQGEAFSSMCVGGDKALMGQIAEQPILVDPYAIKYIASQTAGKSPDEVARFYVQKLIFGNPGYLEHLVARYGLPKDDILKIDAKIQELAKKSIEELGKTKGAELQQDEFKEVGPYLVHRYDVLGTGIIVYDVWEEDNSDHSTIMSIRGKWHGRVGTKVLPEKLAKLPPRSRERITEVMRWQEDEYRRAYGAILEAYPELKDKAVRWSMGEGLTLEKGGIKEGEMGEKIKYYFSAAASEETAPYHKAIPSNIYYYSTTIEKHYLPSSACHKGSIRVVKPVPTGVLVYLGCLKKHKWDAKSSTCSPNPTVIMTIVLNNKENRDEAEHLKLVHPEIKVHHVEGERGVEPRVAEGGEELKAENKELIPVVEAMNKAEEV